MTIQRKQWNVQGLYFLGGIPFLAMVIRNETSNAMVYLFAWIALVQILGLFYLCCPYCSGPISYLFYPMMIRFRCARCGAYLAPQTGKFASQNPPASIPRSIRSPWIQALRLAGALVALNFWLLPSVDGMISITPVRRWAARIGLRTMSIISLGVILGANACYIYGAKKRVQVDPVVH